MTRLSPPSAAEIAAACERYRLASTRRQEWERVSELADTLAARTIAELELSGASLEHELATTELTKLIMLRASAHPR